MKAYALSSLKIGATRHKASTEDEPVVLDLPQKEFNRLEAMGAVRKATDKEVKFAGVEDAEVVDENTAPKATPKSGKSKAAATQADNQAGGDTNLDL